MTGGNKYQGPGTAAHRRQTALVVLASALFVAMFTIGIGGQLRKAFSLGPQTESPTASIPSANLPAPTVLISQNVFATLYAQATQIIAAFTQTAVAGQTSTASMLQTVTESIPLPSSTQLPPLAVQVGFDDSEIQKLEAANINDLRESITFAGHNHQYRLLSIWYSKQQDFDPCPCVAPGGVVLLYQTDTVQPKFLWSRDYWQKDGKTPSIKYIGAPPPGDWNADGNLFFAVYGDQLGNFWGHGFYFIYEVTADGKVISLLKHSIPPGFIVIQIAREDFGPFVLKALDVRGYFTQERTQIIRYFGWSHDQIVNVSDWHIGEYESFFGYEVFSLTTMKVLSDDDARRFASGLYVLLVDYDALNERDAGWVLVQDVVREAKQTNRLPEDTYIDKAFMPTMARLYKEKQMFAPPEAAGDPFNYYQNDD